VRKVILGGIAVSASLGMVLASGAVAGGNGAQRSGLSPQSGSSTNQCVEGSGAGTNGFVIINAPGPPANARFINGEVSLKNGAPDTAYMVEIADGSGNCKPEGALTTNGQGNGNSHLNDATLKGGGTFYVVLTDASGNEQFASRSVTVT
jgi:hypothetical protein